MPTRNFFFVTLFASISFAGFARAQGSNDCASATTLSGLGTFAVSTIGATDSPQQSGACTPAHNDVWFRWTAPQSGVAQIETCGGTGVDTVLAAYAGSTCPGAGSELACNDDSCAFQSSIAFAVTAGNSYMIQAGAWAAGTTFSGTLTIAIPITPGNDDCSSPDIIAGAGPFAFDTTLATTGSEGQTNFTCGNPTGIDRDVWFSWMASTSGPMEVSVCGGASFDTKVAVYSAAGCPSAVALACNDDSCNLQSEAFFSAVAGNTYAVQVGSFPTAPGGAGTFVVIPGSGGCAVPSVGPDVIVGDIVGVLNATAASGLDAVAFGMGACNVGDTVLSWFAPNNQHPVIAANIHRYKVVGGSGRFEQVGMSWLKHGFGAAVDSLCCSCQNPGNSQLLGVGCSDTYDAALNGTQSALGPRWQVNAHTGNFAFPPADPPWSGPTARRCEVALTDLQTTGGGVRYFVEGTYVTPDDAAAGNNDNNESWRELAITGGPSDFSFATSGSTQRTRPAIEAWATAETGVTITTVDVPSEGRFVVGSHATSLGGGIWHYEYAVHNMNSDRNCGTFSVAVPAGATVTNIGFHDVVYRNGDGSGNTNIDGTDWTAAFVGQVLSFTTQTEAQNVRANAIRWGTTYNFRFDADVAPASGTVALGLWKTGSPGSISAAAEVPSGGATTFAYCFGDGSGTACPCGNNSAVGANAGCLSSLNVGGRLTASGTASISNDTFVLDGSSMPNAAALYFQGTAQVAGGAGAVFGDGLRCAGGTVVRLATKTNVAGASGYPQAGDASISVRGQDSAGDVRTYQCWYRNSATFCQPATFNVTNGVQTTWQP